MSEHQQHGENDAESRLRALLGNHALGIVEVTVDGGISLANRALGDWLGIEPSMLVGRELSSLLHPEDNVTLVRQLERLANGTIDSTTIAHRLRRPAGVNLWVRSTWSARRSASGAITHLIAIVDNIAQQREDELVRAILEESIRRLEDRRRFIDRVIGGLPVIAWRALPSGICEYLSPQWCGLTGMRDGSGLRWLGAIHPEDRPLFASAWSDTSPYSDHPKRIACRLRDSDGVYHRYEVVGAPTRNEVGVIEAWTGVMVGGRELTYVAGDAMLSGAAHAADRSLRALKNRLPEPPNGTGYRPA
jgi:PAS domain S-box-containing protein